MAIYSTATGKEIFPEPIPTPTPEPTPEPEPEKKRIFGRIGAAIKKVYQKADVAVGGYLPGGVTPTEVKAIEPIAQPTQEIYVPETQTYQTQTYGTGAGGTVTERAPTISEQIIIDQTRERDVKIDKVFDKVKEVGGKLISPLSTAATEAYTQAELRNLEAEQFTKDQPYAMEVGGTGFIEPKPEIPVETLAKSYPFTSSDLIQTRIEEDLRIKAIQYSLDAQNKLKDKYVQELETESKVYLEQYNQYITNGQFTGTQTQYNSYLKDYDRQQELNKQLFEHQNLRYSQAVNQQVTSNLERDIIASNEELARLGITSRRHRAATLAPFVLLESYVLGKGIVKGLGAIAKYSPTLGKVAGTAVTAGFVAPIVVGAGGIVTAFKEDPLSSTLEIAPMVIGFGAGAKGVKKSITKKDIKFLTDVKPEVSLGVGTTKGVFQIISVKATPKVKAVTLQEFKIIPGTGQIIKGRATQKIIEVKTSKQFGDIGKATFFGESQKVSVFKVKDIKIKGKTILQIRKEIKLEGTAGRVKILTADLKKIDVTFAGIGKVKGKYIGTLYGEIPKGKLIPTGKKGKIVDIKTGEVLEFPFYDPIIKAKLEPKGIGITKIIEAKPTVFDIKPIDTKITKLKYIKPIFDFKPIDTKIKPIKVKPTIKGRPQELIIKPKLDTKVKADIISKTVEKRLLQEVKITKQKYLKEIPYMVGGIGLKILPKPTYAIQEVKIEGRLLIGQLTKTSPFFREDIISAPKMDITTGLKTDVISAPKMDITTGLKTDVISAPKLKITPIVTAVQVPIVKTTQIPIVKTVVVPKQVFRQAQVLKQISEQAQVLKQISIFKPIQIQIPRIIPKIGFPFLYKPSAPTKRKPKKKRVVIKPGKGYEGFYKRFGKWKPLVKGTRAQAVAKVKRKVKRELGASYKVKDLRTGKYIMPEITKQFRRSKSKKTPYVVVERRRYRLDSPKEKGEIKYAKKIKKGGKNTMAKKKVGRPKKKVTRKKKR